jgi:hypothetical protein
MDLFNSTKLDISDINIRNMEEKFSANRTNYTDEKSIKK